MRARLLGALLAALPALATAQETREWGLLVERGEAFLSWATPDAEDEAVGLSCVAGEGVIRLDVWADTTHGFDRTEQGAWRNKSGAVEPWSGYAAVKSGAAREAVEVDAYQHPSGHGSDVRMRIASDSPLWTAFRSTGDLRVEVYDETIAPAPAPQSLLKRFFDACG